MHRFERRRHPRAPIRQQAIVRQGNRSYPAELVDISESGVLFETSGRLAETQSMQLQFRFPWATDMLTLDLAPVRNEEPKSGTTRIAAKFRQLNANAGLMIKLAVSKMLKPEVTEPRAPAAKPRRSSTSGTSKSKKKAPKRPESSLSRMLGRLGL